MGEQVKNFGLIGAAGYIAPRHLKAIRDTGNRLVGACDPHDSVGVLDRFFPGASFFTEIERFDRFLEKLRREDSELQVDWLSVCSPNYLHDAHVRLGLRVRANVLCEKPLTINPWNLDQLAELEEEFDRRVHTVLQLRVHPSLRELKAKLEAEEPRERHEVVLTYVTPRGRWYHISWKGSEAKSGGVAMNIGIHFFDLLMWLFGPVHRIAVHLSESDKMSGTLELERATVRWFLSLDAADLPEGTHRAENKAFRSITIDGQELEFSTGFTDLHTRVYEEMLAGRGFRIEDARPSIRLVHDIRHCEISPPGEKAHPELRG
ncbi:MAG: Gfo/Idh/MocA family oxidoreductase [Planctomycetota bacterium]